MAVPRYLEILKDEGVLAWNKFREESGESNPDLSGAKLEYLDLRRANFRRVNSRRAAGTRRSRATTSAIYLFLLLGAGGHARVLIEAIRLSGAAEIVAAVDANPATHGTKILGVPVAGGDELLPSLAANGATHFVVAVGSVTRNPIRAKLFSLGVNANLLPLSTRHPAAVCSPSAKLAGGAQLLAGCIVSTQAEIGANAIINSGAIVEHDCIIGPHSHIASGACLAGGVIVGEEVLIGARAVIKQNVRIGRGATIGAGAVVLRDVAPGSVVAGVPAESIKK